ncbi:Agmatine coumaroyltransferase [Morus notabilis]|uniref:Agmatine coumaroyltransferase n=1 Tax=Morus notabilis TaxID=981085 RepID=W9QIF5_9ROSA|nr:phenolic glucoside malonyltransferase 1 [Morus notabilis]EXB38112.1 Agmatine coumaroyltransferase [Morus notabilis]
MASTLSKLKHSLSLTLQYYLPLAGTLTWPPSSPKPNVLYNPGDAISLTVAESTVEHFGHVSGDNVREASASSPLVPKLHVTETSASVMALQITMFPNSGICVGITAHHAFLDGKSTTMFMKSWAYVCRENPPLSPELMPFYDRNVVKDDIGLDMVYLNRWLEKTKSKQKVFEHWSETHVQSDLVRGNFQLTRGDIENLKKRVSRINKTSTLQKLSSFVVTSAHVLTCMVRATSSEEDRRNKVYFVVGVDYRTRLDPPVPLNYFGNCVGSHLGYVQVRDCFEEDGLAIVAGKISCLVKGLEKGVLEGAKDRLSKWGSLEPGAQVISITWSPKFGVYGIDFCFGRPKKIEIASIHRKAISLVEYRDENGGIDVGLVLKKHEIDIFASLFRINIS